MRIGVRVSMLAGAAFLLAASQATAVDQWPDTGQSTCYEQDGTIIPCPSAGYPGQDADFQGPAPAYTVSNGTVADAVTGLMWVQDAGVSTALTLTDASAFITTLNTMNSGAGFANYTDWRLPDIFELSSLVNSGVTYDGLTDTAYGDFTLAAEFNPYYWSDTTDPFTGAGADDRMLVRFRHGTVVGSFDEGVTEAHVLAVRP